MNPILIYDGHCGFCAIWVNYGRLLTGDRVNYAPSQEVDHHYPEISPEEFKRSVWFIEADGTRASGAEAVFRLMAHAPGEGWRLWMYRHLPGFAFTSEAAYRFVAGHRSFFYWVTRIFWGADLEPASYRMSRWLFLRGLALVYFLAFLILIPQISGLIGENGILPAHEYLQTIHSEFGGLSYRFFPTLAWLNSSDAFLLAVCWAGCALSVALLLGFLPLPAAIGLYLLYLSIDTVGQAFLSFQWDALLLETGFAAILVARRPSDIGRWVLRFLVFRLMLESGLVKILSGDAAWRSLTALNFHYETQPLPTPLAWYAHQLPRTFQKMSVAGVFFVELAVPFLFFLPRRLRIIGAWVTILFQLLIAATGNYTFFNLLTIVLCVPLFDDRHLRRFLPAGLGRSGELKNGRVAIALGAVLIFIGLLQLLTMVGLLRTVPEPGASVVEQAEIFHIVSRYGLFAVMTTSRPEIVIEGSNDGQDWKTYEFKFKPGDVTQPPRWTAPYQPRLDWQMWFAALSNYQSNPWFSQLMLRLLQGSPEVLGLLATNPFPGKPPRFIRAVVYDYHFSDFATRRSTGAWWTRRELGAYFPAVSLR